MTPEEARLVLHENQSDALNLALQGTTFPKAVLLLWDPANPECYSIVGNADDGIMAAIVEVVYRGAAPQQKGGGDGR